jgi:hypothetical protein
MTSENIEPTIYERFLRKLSNEELLAEIRRQGADTKRMLDELEIQNEKEVAHE